MVEDEGTEVVVGFWAVNDDVSVGGPGLTTVSENGLHLAQTVVTGTSVIVTVAGFGEIVVATVFTTVTCAENADDAEAPAPPSTGTTDQVGLLLRASS